MNYYNEFDTDAADWLENLILAGEIPFGVVDRRDIREVAGADLAGFTQCHFFAGIGGWSLALRLAQWPETQPVWTGSCPCQPFSAAGKQKGTSDERHMWPDFWRLIAECSPAIVFGEQVASADGRQWLGGVRLDPESVGYQLGAADLCAAGIGAPHIRQRLFFGAIRLGDADDDGRETGRSAVQAMGYGYPANSAGGQCDGGRLADANKLTQFEPQYEVSAEPRRDAGPDVGGAGSGFAQGRGRLADANQFEFQRDGNPGSVASPAGTGTPEERQRRGHAARDRDTGSGGLGNPENGGLARPARFARSICPELPAAERASPWADAEWIDCGDGKSRRVKSCVPLLVDGRPRDVAAALSGLGNAIVPELAAQFIESFAAAASEAAPCDQ